MKPDRSLAYIAVEKANLFADLFGKKSHLNIDNRNPPSIPSCDTFMSKIVIRTKDVRSILGNLEVNN